MVLIKAQGLKHSGACEVQQLSEQLSAPQKGHSYSVSSTDRASELLRHLEE